MVLRPLDEVGHDQEVAGIFHPVDDAELEIEARRGIRPRSCLRRMPCRSEAALEALLGALAQLRGFVDGAVADREARQDRLGACAGGTRSAAAISTVVASASGRSANSAAISARLLKRCSGVSWRRSLSATSGLRRCRSARHAPRSRRRWRNNGSLVATSGSVMRVGEIDQRRLGARARAGVPWRCSST